MISFLKPSKKIFFSLRISLVAPGGRHTLMLTESGEVYTCGSNDFGQLGREGSQTRFTINFRHKQKQLIKNVSDLNKYKVCPNIV